MQAAERAHNFIVDFSLIDINRRRGVAMSIIVSISAVQSRRLDVEMRCRTVAVQSSLIPVSLWASTTLDVESPTELFVASH